MVEFPLRFISTLQKFCKVGDLNVSALAMLLFIMWTLTFVFISLLNNANNNSLQFYIAFMGTQSTLHRRGESPQPPPACSIYLDDAMAAILRQNAHHTPAYWWRGDMMMDRGQWPNLARTPGLHPYSFLKDILRTSV